MSSKANRSICIVDGPESYQTMKTAFSEVFKDINNLIKEGEIDVDGKTIELDFYLGGDYKFLLMIMGLTNATSNYACLWCLIHKSNRWDMSKSLEYYNSPPMKRTLKDLKDCCNKSTNNYCCESPPLLNIELDHIILDELHLLLRVCDRLIENLIQDCDVKDSIAEFDGQRASKKGVNLQKLVNAINQCGVSFSVWNCKNADGSQSKIREFTSLLGCEKKKLIHLLPDKLRGILCDETCEVVIDIWKKFADIYTMLSKWDLSSQSYLTVHQQGKELINLLRKANTLPKIK